MLLSEHDLKNILGNDNGIRLFNILRTSQISGKKIKQQHRKIMVMSYDYDEIIIELKRKIKEAHRLSRIDDLSNWLSILKEHK